MDPSETPSSDPEAHAFEALLQAQPLRPVPRELRNTILSRHAQEGRPAERRPSPSGWEIWWTRMSSPVTGLAAIWILAWVGFQLDTWILGSPIPSAAVPSAQTLREAREERLALLRALESQNHQTEPEPRSPAHLQPRSHLRQRLRPGQAQGLPSAQLTWTGRDLGRFDHEVEASTVGPWSLTAPSRSPRCAQIHTTMLSGPPMPQGTRLPDTLTEPSRDRWGRQGRRYQGPGPSLPMLDHIPIPEYPLPLLNV